MEPVQGNNSNAPEPGSHPQVKAALLTAAASLLVAFLTSWTTLRAKSADATTKFQEFDNLVSKARNEARFPFIPSGTIQAYGGELDTGEMIKKGWLFCDGRPYSTNDFPELFLALGFAWGRGDAVNEFRVPNLQGLFLRGVDPSGRVDLGSADRADVRGEKVGPVVGSLQKDEVGKHQHVTAVFFGYSWNQPGQFSSTSTGNGTSGGDHQNAPQTNTKDNAGNETRPKNAYVHYIIKY